MSHGQPNRSGERESIGRVVPVFYPWHRIQEIRLAEPEEKQMDDDTGASDEGQASGESSTRVARARSIRRPQLA